MSQDNFMVSISLRYPTKLTELQHLVFHTIGGGCKSSGIMGARKTVTVKFIHINCSEKGHRARM